MAMSAAITRQNVRRAVAVGRGGGYMVFFSGGFSGGGRSALGDLEQVRDSVARSFANLHALDREALDGLRADIQEARGLRG